MFNNTLIISHEVLNFIKIIGSSSNIKGKQYYAVGPLIFMEIGTTSTGSVVVEVMSFKELTNAISNDNMMYNIAIFSYSDILNIVKHLKAHSFQEPEKYEDMDELKNDVVETVESIISQLNDDKMTEALNTFIAVHKKSETLDNINKIEDESF